MHTSYSQAREELQQLWDEACTGPKDRDAFYADLGDLYTLEALERMDKTVATLRTYLERARMWSRLFVCHCVYMYICTCISICICLC